MVNQNFDEVYGNNFVTELMLNDNIVGAAELKVTGNGTDGQILKSDGDGTFSWINNDEGDLTAIVAGTGLDGTDLSGPIPTINIETGGVGTTQLADDGVTHDKLENRYTAINSIGTTSGAFNIDFSLGAIQTATLGGAHTGTFTNFKVGQVIDIIITGNYALTFSATASGTPAINKVGTTDYDGTATQIIQVQCASDDSTTPIFYYACNTYAVNTTP